MPTVSHHLNERGNILLVAIIFLGIFVTVGAALLNYLVVFSRAERITIASTQALALAEGAIDHAAYQLNLDPSYTGEADVPLGNGTFTITVSSIDSSTKRVTATAYVPDSANPISTKSIRADIGLTDDVISFHYGIQAGRGGFTLEQSSSITGNVFAAGPVTGDGGNYIRGDVVSAGADGIIYGVHATSSAYAHTIGKAGETTTIDRDAYYTTKVNTTVSGTSHPGSPDQASVPLPISDSQIAEWENQAAAGGTITSCNENGDYIVNSTMTLGPVRIDCNLIIKSSSATLTIAGHLWVAGNIKMQTGPTIKMAESLGSTNVAIIADNPEDQTESSRIEVGQTTIFQGSGAPNSFVFLISQNKSAELGGDEVAVSMAQGASALVAYASHGLLTLSQSVSVKEATGYRITLKNSANVVYDTGLPSTVFQSGPGGSWNFVPGTYAITR